MRQNSLLDYINRILVYVIVAGEFMQLGSKQHPDERFHHYLEKTYKKTASLIACCCKAVSLQT